MSVRTHDQPKQTATMTRMAADRIIDLRRNTPSTKVAGQVALEPCSRGSPAAVNRPNTRNNAMPGPKESTNIVTIPHAPSCPKTAVGRTSLNDSASKPTVVVSAAKAQALNT